MKIIIADDTVENLNAAKEAAKAFPEHEFLFTNSASEAIKLLPDYDGVVTDLFFPPEGHLEHGNPLFFPYNRYEEGLIGADYTPMFDEVVAQRNYDGDRRKASEDLRNAVGLVADGTIRKSVESFIKAIEKWPENMRESRESRLSSLRELLDNLPPPQFPYGAAVILAAKRARKRHVLVTDMHRHASGTSQASAAISGLVLLIPLIAERITSAYEVQWDGGENSSTYLGSDRVRKLAGDTEPAKSSPAVWAEAMRLVAL